MSESYVECLVKKEETVFGKVARILLVMLTVLFGLLTVAGFPFALFAALPAGFGAYFVYLHTDIEYEYLYIDKELHVDKIMAKTKRKKVITFDIERMEIFAPLNSYHLDGYRNRTCKSLDFSTGVEEKPEKRYVMYFDGSQKVVLSPGEELVKAIRNVAPRKVFTE